MQDIWNQPNLIKLNNINDDLLNIESKLNNKLKIISYDDGIITTYLNYNVMSGLGFCNINCGLKFISINYEFLFNCSQSDPLLLQSAAGRLVAGLSANNVGQTASKPGRRTVQC